MRASSLSNSEVLDLLSRYFVPVLYSVDDYEQAKKNKAAADEWDRIRQLAERRGLARGTVCVYLVAPGGGVLDSMLVDQAMKPAALVPMLKRVIEAEKLQPRDPETIASAHAARLPKDGSDRGGRRLNIWTRNLGANASLGASQDRLELTAAEWAGFLPDSEIRRGISWKVSQQLIDKLYPYFFPPIQNYDSRNSTILKASLNANATDVSPKQVRLSLRGKLEMDHPLRPVEKPLAFPAKTNGRVTATAVGSALFDREKRTVRAFQMVSEEADYLWHWQGNPVQWPFVLAAELGPVN